MGIGDRSNQLFAIDFGLSRKYRNPATLEHVPYSDGRLLTGTARYASVRVLSGVEPTRRDDLESLGYLLCYFMQGRLPWMGLSAANPESKNAKVLSLKKRITPADLCAGLPEEFRRYIESVRALRFAERPPYEEYRERFRELFVRCGYNWDYKFDWNDGKRPKRPAPKSAPRTPRASVFRQASAAVLGDHGKRTPAVRNPRLAPKAGRPARLAAIGKGFGN
jgi:casein kinase 1